MSTEDWRDIGGGSVAADAVTEAKFRDSDKHTHIFMQPLPYKLTAHLCTVQTG